LHKNTDLCRPFDSLEWRRHTSPSSSSFQFRTDFTFLFATKTLSLWNKRVWLTQVPKNFAKVFRWNFSSRTIANLSCNNVTENQSVVESTKWLSKVQKLLFISRKWLYKSVSPLLFLLLFWVCHNLQILKVRMLSNNLFSH